MNVKVSHGDRERQPDASQTHKSPLKLNSKAGLRWDDRLVRILNFMTTEQKFKRGDVVHIAADLGPFMSHFPADKDAIVMGSYRDQYGGDRKVNDYTVMFLDTGETCSWYHTCQLTLIRHGGEEEIARVKAARADREKYETDLAWIVENWANIREMVPGATIGELMRRLGIVNPWGACGEGITYYSNAMATFHLLDPILSTGDLAHVESFFANVTTEAREK